MANVPQINIVAPKRVPFDDTIAMMGVDYSGATPVMQIRPQPGTTGTPVVALGASSSGSEGIVVTYDGGYPDPDDVLPAGATIVRIIVNEATLEGLALEATPERNAEFYYDIHLTPSGGKKFIFCGGKFIVSPGVTI